MPQSQVGKQDFRARYGSLRSQPDNANGLTMESAVDTLQMRGVDTRRFLTKRGRLTATLMAEISGAIAAIIDYQ